MDISIECAAPALDAEISRFVRDLPSDGALALASNPTSSFFDTLSLEGYESQVLVATQARKLPAIGVRNLRHCHLNGNPIPSCVGYLGGLRIAPHAQRRTILARGFKALQQLHLGGECALYLTTILASNTRALQALTAKRANLPSYHPVGIYRTYIYNPRALQQTCRYRSDSAGEGREMVGTAQHIPALQSFLHYQSQRRQFFPAYSATELLHGSSALRGLSIDRFLLAYRNSADAEICASLALWDQQAVRSWMVRKYTGKLRLLRPLYNVAASLSKRPLLPRAGKALNYALIGLPLCREGSTDCFERLLIQAAQLGAQYDYLLLGLHENDPLNTIAVSFPHFKIESQVYVVHWQDGQSSFEQLLPLVPYLELGSL